jgi:nitroimidazol reductase NimA-like FMN-containing flavoprotein (pyridoxamine 5'-phosphate oxidase superfamily)
VFPSNTGTRLHAALRSPSVAFEADGVSDDASRGWSVLVVGHAEEVDDPESIARLMPCPAPLWRPGAHLCWMRVVPSKITGRRICDANRAVLPLPEQQMVLRTS